MPLIVGCFGVCTQAAIQSALFEVGRMKYKGIAIVMLSVFLAAVSLAQNQPLNGRFRFRSESMNRSGSRERSTTPWVFARASLVARSVAVRNAPDRISTLPTVIRGPPIRPLKALSAGKSIICADIQKIFKRDPTVIATFCSLGEHPSTKAQGGIE